MKKFSARVALILVVFTLSGCGSSSQGNESAAVLLAEERKIAQEKWDVISDIKGQTLAYIDFNCTPKYETEVTDFGDGIVTRIKYMYVFNKEKFNGPFGYAGEGYPQEAINLIISDPTNSTYGNLAVRATYLSSVYHFSLSGLYTDIYDLWSSELKSYRKDYTRFKAISDKAGKKLCPITKNSYDLDVLDPADLKKVQGIYDELAASWPGLVTWYAAVKEISTNLSNRLNLDYEDSITPKCNEYPSADGKYVVVKCTVPPG